MKTHQTYKTKRCGPCAGTGRFLGNMATCANCGGTGVVKIKTNGKTKPVKR